MKQLSKTNFVARVVLATLGTAVLAASAFGQTQQTQTFSASIGLSTTNWTAGIDGVPSMTFSQFDPSLGTLECIEIALSGTVQGEASAESQDNAETTITLDLQALISLSFPPTPTGPGGTIATVLPVVSNSFMVTSFDGSIDFAGTSGVATGTVNATDTNTALLNLPLDLAVFTGTGNITLPVEAEGASVGSGAGNLISSFATDAGSSVTVTYKYEPVPEPASAALMMIAGLGLLGMRRRR